MEVDVLAQGDRNCEGLSSRETVAGQQSSSEFFLWFGDVDLRADAAGLRANAVHKRDVLWFVAHLCACPCLAAVIVIHTAGGADAAGLGTFFHNGKRVALALPVVSPDVALCGVLVGTRHPVAHATRLGTLLEHVRCILVAFAIGCPSGTVRVLVLAGAFTRRARDRTIAHHELRIVVAAPCQGPSIALEL